MLVEITTSKPEAEDSQTKLHHLISVVEQVRLDLRKLTKVKERAKSHSLTAVEQLLPDDLKTMDL